MNCPKCGGSLDGITNDSEDFGCGVAWMCNDCDWVEGNDGLEAICDDDYEDEFC